MTEPKDPSEDTLSVLYSKRKSEYRAPTTIKRKILKAQLTENTHTAIFNRISYVAVAASTLLLVGVILLRQEQLNMPELTYQTVEIHSLKPSNELSSASIRNRYAQNYKTYLEHQKAFAQHHQKHATLTVTGKFWELKTCDDEIMQISEELIVALNKIQRIDSKLSSGDIVQIAFDQSGMILGIQGSSVHLN
ncbi:MAG: hypothetical protein ABJH06_07935, partial [Paraglaciecola sp.]|uniref:hypothetical protein n=1 Tax=Paraglaciecola sp. TaxID=1920173 RepID=UPI003298AF92